MSKKPHCALLILLSAVATITQTESARPRQYAGHAAAAQKNAEPAAIPLHLRLTRMIVTSAT
jgi:hypothetical protein